MRPSDNWFSVEAFADAVNSDPEDLGQDYDLEHHLSKMSGKSMALFRRLREGILGLEGVSEEFLNQYIGYRREKNFAEVVGQKKGLLVFIDGPVHDPSGLGEDVSNIGHWGTGDLRMKITTDADVEAAMPLIEQAHALQR